MGEPRRKYVTPSGFSRIKNMHGKLTTRPILEFQYKLGKHRSNALELIQKVPPIEVDGDIAVCDGGGGALGHPLVS